MFLEIHPNFKSLAPNFTSVEDIELLNRALEKQHKLEMRTTPSEFKQWNYDEFVINMEKIDILYQFFHFEDQIQQINEFELIARIDDGNGMFYYIHLDACYNDSGFDCQESEGYIFICRNADLFMRNLYSSEYFVLPKKKKK